MILILSPKQKISMKKNGKGMMTYGEDGWIGTGKIREPEEGKETECTIYVWDCHRKKNSKKKGKNEKFSGKRERKELK